MPRYTATTPDRFYTGRPEDFLSPTERKRLAGKPGIVAEARAGLRRHAYGPGAAMVARLVRRLEQLQAENRNG